MIGCGKCQYNSLIALFELFNIIKMNSLRIIFEDSKDRRSRYVVLPLKCALNHNSLQQNMKEIDNDHAFGSKNRVVGLLEPGQIITHAF